ncbi:ArsR/SmtB family transcription factor [Mycolicibacterium nivoides]|uniref:ArsR/SmtB family transcription factor n=1 Tax=Mycolicibacterium nivoides TaxID=2487344 RepID=UPI003C2C62CA
MELLGTVNEARLALVDVDTAAWALRFDLLSDPHRLDILLAMHRVPGICVGDLAAAVGHSENSVSQALRVLRRGGWVTCTRVGRAVHYELDNDAVHGLLHWIGAGKS